MWKRFELQLTFDHRQCDQPVMRCHDNIQTARHVCSWHHPLPSNRAHYWL